VYNIGLYAFLLALYKEDADMNMLLFAMFVVASIFSFFWIQPIGRVELLSSNQSLCVWFVVGTAMWGGRAAFQSGIFKNDMTPGDTLPFSYFISIVLGAMSLMPILYDCAMSVVLAVTANIALAVYVPFLPIRIWWRRTQFVTPETEHVC
jgi:hypothetical protein